METRWHVLVVWASICWSLGYGKLPSFTKDMNNLALSENIPVGQMVYRLQGVSAEGHPLKYGLVGTQKFKVNPDTGDVTLVEPLDREMEDTIKFLVQIEESNDLKQMQPVTVIVLDENDNPPTFKNSPYEIYVPEDQAIGTTLLNTIEVVDADTVGDNLEIECVLIEQWPEACQTFEVVALQSSSNLYRGALVLKRPLDYNEKQFYQFQLFATDGTLNSTTHIEVKVVDVQNSPPVFMGSLTAALTEDVQVGTLVLTIKARDSDRAQPRPVALDLVTNPFDYFVLDSPSGELRTAKPLDREALEDPSSPLNITVRASEYVDGIPLISNLTSTLATVTITIKDVNDEPPKFNKREYFIEIPESLPVGTPLPNLDMIVMDKDVGANSVFSLRLSDQMGAFVVEPSLATGSASVTLRLNKTLDYEDPNQRKFIVEVIAEEEVNAPPRLSSKASVTITLLDVNDNAPKFLEEPYSATISETAPYGTKVAQIIATDRDTGRFGTDGIVYELSGNGADLFDVDEKTGTITVAACKTPGVQPCLDYENRRDYFLQYKATDDNGLGQGSVVSLQISLTDSNDNPPIFSTQVYKASIDEDATKFEPDLQVQARDVDVSSEIRYSIISPTEHPFSIDPLTGKISVKINSGVQSDGNRIILTVMAFDGIHNATCKVEIAVRDVNNHAPMFDEEKYDADISEDAPIGTEVAAVRATDMDSGENAEIKYAILKGALDSFTINNLTGVITVYSELDYDRRNTYKIQIIATDHGMPSLTGTTELTIHVINVNDKKPYFTPTIQRAEVSADAELGTQVHNLVAVDPDISNPNLLIYGLSNEKVIGAVLNGKEISAEGIFDSWFAVLPNGTVIVSQKLDHNRAAVITLPVTVTDTSAPTLQRTDGELIITIVDVNRNAPFFTMPAYTEQMIEEQPPGTILNTYTATDKETPISSYVIDPPNPYFEINNVTGTVKTTQRIDFEKLDSINFTLVAYDSGVPVRSGTAAVTVQIINSNDEEPVFAAEQYDAAILEGAVAGTRVLTVTAVDLDHGEFGVINYSLNGELANLFNIDPFTGLITVAHDANIDRETTSDIFLRAVATDQAPMHLKRSTSVPIHIKVLDVNDNHPVFTQKVYKSTIAENLQLNPPAAILQVLAEDKDEGVNGKVVYNILSQSEPGIFTVGRISGIISPAKPVTGNTTYHLTVIAIDENGAGLNDTAKVDIHVLSVNKHSPVFVEPPPDVKQLDIPENAAQADYLITTVKALDEDEGENGRVSYYLKVDNKNVEETPEFSLDKDTGELRTKTFLDREHKSEYQLVIAAVDNGTPAQFESLRLLSVVLQDENDNVPKFEDYTYQFALRENLPTGVIIASARDHKNLWKTIRKKYPKQLSVMSVAKNIAEELNCESSVKALDKDSGDNGKVYYHILEGNENGAFALDRVQGTLRANISFDRETQEDYFLTIYASNNPLVERVAAILNTIENNTDIQNPSIATIKIKILDENDNPPKFTEKVYYAGIKYTTRINEPIIPVVAEDPDLDENGTIVYLVAASNLYKFGASTSSGSIVPSPFNISQDGILMTAAYMSEYNQDRFVLDIIAQEIAPPFRQAKAQVFIWVIDRTSLIRMVVSRGCAEGAGAAGRLAGAGNAKLVPSARLPLHRDNWCEIHMHAVDPTTYQVLPVETVLETIDSKYDELKDVYQQYGVETLIAASATSKAPDSFDPALAALIALLIVLFTGIVTFIVVCACLKHWVIPPPSMQSSKGDSLARRKILEELSTTENPLWLETKLRPYEEQELTMNVFGDQAEQSANVEQCQAPDNTYATIPGARAERLGDYATLGGGQDSPTSLEAAMGFQGSTFKPPTPETPEPPPRPSGMAL